MLDILLRVHECFDRDELFLLAEDVGLSPDLLENMPVEGVQQVLFDHVAGFVQIGV